MPQRSDPQIEERLTELERELGPALRAAYSTHPMRTSFPFELRQRLNALLSRPRPRPYLRAVGHPGWTALAAALVIGLASSVALFANRPQPASAAEVLDRVQAEAIAASTSSVDGASCAKAPGSTATGTIGFVAGGPGGKTDLQVHSGTASQLSDRLAEALGVSGDRFRQAMLQAIGADLPAGPPPDPIAGIAQQLGVSQQQVCAAFFTGQEAGQTFSVSDSTRADRDGGNVQIVNLGGTQIDVGHVDATQLSAPAQRLGVSPDRLAAALRAALPSLPPPSTPPSKDQIVSRLARNLDISEDRVRAAITQVEGPNQFYFVVPFPAFGKQ